MGTENTKEYSRTERQEKINEAINYLLHKEAIRTVEILGQLFFVDKDFNRIYDTKGNEYVVLN